MAGKDQTDCERVQRSIPLFVSGRLSDGEMKDFIRHVRHCRNCQEELMTYDILEYGLKEKKTLPHTDAESLRLIRDYDFQGLMRKQLADMETEVRRKEAWEHLSVLALGIADIATLAAMALMLLEQW